MNSTHALAAGSGLLGGTSVQQALMTILTGWHGMNAGQAAAWAYLIVLGITLIGSAITVIVRRFLPARQNDHNA